MSRSVLSKRTSRSFASAPVQVPVGPGEGFAHQLGSGDEVPPFGDHLALPIRRGAKEAEHRALRGLDREEVIVLPVQQEHRDRDTGQESIGSTSGWPRWYSSPATSSTREPGIE